MSAFVDTNILIYCIEKDPKAERAFDIMKDLPEASVQSLNEFAFTMRRKQKAPWEEIDRALTFLRPLISRIHPIDEPDHDRARALSRTMKIGWWDSLLLAVALKSGATTFYSEDMQHEFVVDGRMTIINPFRA